ncbi:MAG TPA: nitroreductase family protein [Acidimicrobiales bacterium]
MDALEAIFARRSIGRLAEPGPSDAELDTILRAAAAAPDHLSLRPLRLIVLQGEAKDDFGAVLAAAYAARCDEAGEAVVPAKQDKERTKLGRAPVVVVAAAAETTGGRIPFIEQQLAAGAAAENAMIAATALGYGSMWRTGDAAYDSNVKAALGLEEWESIVGFLYLGTAPDGAGPGPHDPDLDGLARTWAP